MLDLIKLESTKVKRTSMGKIIVALTLLPPVLIMIQYLCIKDDNKDFFTTLTGSNVIITMCLCTSLIIFSSYIFSREYQDKTYIYLFISPKSKRSIFVAKYLTVLVEMLISCGGSYGITLLMNVIFGDVDSEIIEKFLLAWLCGVSLLFLLMPFIVAINIWKKNFISSMLIALVLLIFTFPFMFKENFYIFPQLVPMAVVNNLLRVEDKIDINYGLVYGIMIGVFAIFTVLSLRAFEKKE